MKNTVVRFSLYGVAFESQPVTVETAREMVAQLRDRDIKEAAIAPATPRSMWMIVGLDRGDGHYRGM